MNSLRKAPQPAAAHAAVTQAQVDEAHAGQRLDNYLFRMLKGVPKSHVYRILRTGQVRVNSARAEATYRLQPGDRVRIPPLRMAARAAPAHMGSDFVPLLSRRTLYEDDHVLVIDKPAGMAAHGGSGVSHGVIEQLRRERPELRVLELVHRLDRDTSGVLVLAKKRSALTQLHRQLREGEVEKRYLVLVAGAWRNATQAVKLPLRKYVTAAGERRVSIDAGGIAAHTVFTLQRRLTGFSLLEAELKTGRTHQIRVHLAHLGFPVAGDDKYGDFALNKALPRQGLKRMFLHAAALTFTHPASGEPLRLSAPLAADLAQFLDRLEAAPPPPAAVEG
jgi:23S rRNA pseudouridine955/2504/2580 synthase